MTAKQTKLKKSLIKGIHISKRYQEYYKNDRDTYEHILDDVFGVKSSKELDIDQLKAFVAWLNYKTDELRIDKRKSTATAAQIRKIKELWGTVARNPSDQALREFVHEITHNLYIHIEGISKKDAQKMIPVLKKMNKEK